jgi:hypothetical protein
MIEGWRNYSGHVLKHGQVLMLNEVDNAYVVDNEFISENITYDYVATGAKIDEDGTFYDHNDNDIILGKITGIYEEGFLNET